MGDSRLSRGVFSQAAWASGVQFMNRSPHADGAENIHDFFCANSAAGEGSQVSAAWGSLLWLLPSEGWGANISCKWLFKISKRAIEKNAKQNANYAIFLDI